MKKTYAFILLVSIFTFGFGQSNLLLNGTFDNASNLTFDPDYAISGGVAVYTHSDGSAIFDWDLSSNLTASTAYTLSMDILNSVGDSRFRVLVNQGGTFIEVVANTTYPDGTANIAFTTPIGAECTQVRIVTSSVASSFDFDNAVLGNSIATIDRENGIGPTLTDNVASMSSAGLTRGAGLNLANAANLNSFSSNNYTIGGDLALAQANDDYIEWSITANTAFEIALVELDIRLRRNANGPENWQIFYSLDGFTSPGVALTTPQTLAENTTTNFNFPALGVNSGVSGTITFRVYSWGALANNGNFRVFGQTAWSISPAVPNPGIRLKGEVIPPAFPVSIDSDITASGIAQENIDYSLYNATSGLSIFPFPTPPNAIIIDQFTIRDGGNVSPDSDTNPTILASIEFEILNSENIAALAIFDANTFANIAEVTTVGPLVSFNGLSLTAPDDGTKSFFIAATFKSTVTDNAQVQATVNSAITPGIGSSLFTDSDAGGAETSISGDDNRIEVTVTQFQFAEQPTDGNELELMVPFPTLLAVDNNLNQDVDANVAGINISSSGVSLVPETYDMTNGFAVLDNVVFTGTESGITLLANQGSFSGTSTTFNINGPLINIAQQNFDTATGWGYVSDTPFFGTITDWANGEGYLGEIALVDAAPLDNPLFNDEIFGENDLNDPPGNPFAILTFDDIDVSNFSNLRIEFDWQVVGYVNNGNDVQYRLVFDGSTGGTGGWQSIFDGNGDINDDQGRVKITIPDGNSTVGIQVRFRNNLATGYSGFDNFRLVSEFDGLIYTNSGGWRNNIAPDATTGALDALVINGTYNLSGNVQINNFLIQAAGTTVIPVSQSLTVNGSLITNGTLELNSASNTYSSLIVNGNSLGEVTYFRHVNQLADTGAVTGQNDLISAPVTSDSQDFLALQNANPDLPSGTIGGVPSFLFGPFDNNTNNYINYTAANNSDLIEVGIGYRTASVQTGGSPFTFTGNVVTDSPSVAITASNSRFNLIGNPFPSYISLSGFLATNNSEFDPEVSGVYGYSGNFDDGFTIWNQAYSDANPNALIAPGQGFFVSSQIGGGTINFPSTIRSIGTADDFIPGRPASSGSIAHIKLELSQAEKHTFTDLYFSDNASLGLDPGYDSGVFETSPDFAIFSHLVENNTGRDIAVQSVGFNDLANVTIPLGLNVSAGEQITISITETTLPEDTDVYLEDNVTNTFTRLDEGEYTFTPNTTLNGTGRFFINFSRAQLNTVENVLTNLEIFATSNPKTITIKGQLSIETQAKVFDLQGRVVLAKSLELQSSTQTLDTSNISTGVYVVQLENAQGSRTQKVIIR